MDKLPANNGKSRLDDLDDFIALCKATGCKLDVIDDARVLAEPVKVNHLNFPNSLAIHPMEGADGDGEGGPGSLTIRRYQRFAAGGAGLIWAEAIAVAPEGRANPRQLWLHRKNVDAFKDMVAQMRQSAVDSMGARHKPVIVAQLTHSGRYSRPEEISRPLITQRNPYLDSFASELFPAMHQVGNISDDSIVSDDYLDQLQDAYVKTAELAYQAGFDAVDIKACHGYLINELLASRNRPGKYGGDFENRTRFMLEVIDKIKAKLRDKLEVCTRLGFYDAIPYPYGWGVDQTDYTKPDLAEPCALVHLLHQKGVRLINFTIANPYYNPHLVRPFDLPVKGAYAMPELPLKGVERLIVLCGKVQKTFPDMTFVGTGYTWLRQWMVGVAAAVKLTGKAKIIGVGRMALAYPDFAKDILAKGALDTDKICINCSICSQLLRDGRPTGCVVRDNKTYRY